MEKIDKIILNIPHSSTNGIEFSGWDDKEKLVGLVNRWTDWHTDRLFAPNNNPKVKSVKFNMSRFVVDPERLVDDPLEAIGQGILYTSYDGCRRDIPDLEKTFLMNKYWEHISNLNAEIVDHSLVIDCHSFPKDLSDVDICIGYNEDWSKSEELVAYVKGIFEDRGYKVGVNDPYSNSITPNNDKDYKSLMIEVNKRCYLREDNTMNLDSLYAPRITGIMNKIYKDLLK